MTNNCSECPASLLCLAIPPDEIYKCEICGVLAVRWDNYKLEPGARFIYDVKACPAPRVKDTTRWQCSYCRERRASLESQKDT